MAVFTWQMEMGFQTPLSYTIGIYFGQHLFCFEVFIVVKDVFVFFCSDIIGSHMLSQYSDKKIGGVGLTVEIDESLFGSLICFILDK